MPDIGSSQLDLIVYIVPGYVVLLAMVYTWSPRRFAAQRERLGAGEVLGSVIGALLLGIFIHQVATFMLNTLDNWFTWPTYARIVRRFEHIEQVNTKVTQLLGFVPSDIADCYFYGRVLIAEKAPRVAESAERLLRLANVCQNMLFAAPIAALILTFSRQLRNRGWVQRFAIPLLITIAVDLVFFYGLRMYWTAAIWRTLRATLLLT